MTLTYATRTAEGLEAHTLASALEASAARWQSLLLFKKA